MPRSLVPASLAYRVVCVALDAPPVDATVKPRLFGAWSRSPAPRTSRVRLSGRRNCL